MRVEAWSCGVPLVATASVGPKWLIEDGEDAILTPIDDVDALAAAIKRVVSSPSLEVRLAAAGLKRVAQEFSESAIVARYIHLFQQVTGKVH